MCNLFSGVFTEKKFLYRWDNDHHEVTIEENGLKDDKLPPDFVRVELTPVGEIFDLTPANWKFSVTHADSVPAWWTSAKAKKAEAQMRKVFLAEVAPNRIFAAGEVQALQDCTYYASGQATVRAYGQVTVRASDQATVEAHDHATVEAHGQATVGAYDHATVWAYDHATVWAYDQATVEAAGHATVGAYDHATVWAYDYATVKAFDYATVKANDSATIHGRHDSVIRSWGFKKITVAENSIHIEYRHEDPQITVANQKIGLCYET